MLTPQAQDSLDVELMQLILPIDREDSNLDGECRRVIASVEYDGPDDSRIDGSIPKLIQRGWENAWRTQKVVYSALFSPGSMAPDSRECREADALHHVFRAMIGLVVEGSTSRTRRELRDSIEDYLSVRGIKVEKEAGQDLSGRQFNILEALYQLGAFDADNLQTTATIAKKAEGNQAYAEQFKEPIADLKKRGLIHTKEGRDGGCWLTQQGNAFIKRVRKL